MPSIMSWYLEIKTKIFQKSCNNFQFWSSKSMLVSWKSGAVYKNCTGAAFFISKNWKWFSKLCRFWIYQNFVKIPREFDFRIFAQFLKLRGWHPYAWVFDPQNHQVCIFYYAGYFGIKNWVHFGSWLAKQGTRWAQESYEDLQRVKPK